jgi:hypothetical protein
LYVIAPLHHLLIFQGNLDDKKFRNRLEEIKLEGTSLVLVVEDIGRKKIIGAGTLHIEKKFSRSAGSV